jgi:hypothetical protein
MKKSERLDGLRGHLWTATLGVALLNLAIG